MNGNGPLKVQTDDSLVYIYQNFNYNDKAIFGIAKVYKKDQMIERAATINFKNIVNIEKYTLNGWKTVWLIFSSVAIVSAISSIGSDSFSIIENPNIGNSGSCPYIYSFDGENYNLEGEAFGISLGKQLESQTGIILRKSSTVDDKIKMKITNERPETHFINSVSLFAYEKERDKQVFVDNNNKLIQVSKLCNVSFDEVANKDSLSELTYNIDNIYWESDLSTANNKSGFEDSFVINLSNVDAEDSLTLIVNAINTDISAVVFKYLQTILGDEYANFVRAVDIDPDVICSLNKTLERSALKIDSWDGNNWVYSSLILPEASAVNFTKAARIPIIFSDNGNVKLRFRCLTDVWKIDALFFDDKNPSYPKMHNCKLIGYKTDSHNGQNQDIILDADNNYMTLLPNNSLELEYSSPSKFILKNIEYVVFVKGYLYEWLIDYGMIPGQILSELNPNTAKLSFVKSMIKDIDKILPIIYDEWAKIKEKRMIESK